MIELVAPLVAVFTALVAFFAYLLIKVPHSYRLKWFGIPLLLLSAVFSYHIFESNLGYAYEHELPETFIYLDHIVVVGDNDTPITEVWTLSKTGSTRLYRSKLPPNVLLGLEKAKKKYNATRIPQIIQLHKKGKTHNGEWQFDMESYDLPYEEVAPKEPQ